MNKCKQFLKGLFLLAFVGLLAFAVGRPNMASADAASSALPPQMGWSSWNAFRQNVSEQQINGIADTLVKSGLSDAGYRYLNIDDDWQSAQRDQNGSLQWNPATFPSGANLITQLHQKGLKVGLYTSVGDLTCEDMPGSLWHEQKDATTFAQWGVDYLKDDYCHVVDMDSDMPTPDGFFSIAPDVDYISLASAGSGEGTHMQAEAATLSGNATVKSGGGADGGQYVTGLSKNGGTITFNNVLATQAGQYTLTIGVYKTYSQYTKYIQAVVNGAKTYDTIESRTSGWSPTARVQIPIQLHEGTNTITLQNPITNQLTDSQMRYSKMGNALKEATTAQAAITGNPVRPVFYSISEHGRTQPWTWAGNYANSWRTTHDISASWGSMLTNYDATVGLYAYQKPGAYNDPDMLEVGNGLSYEENKSHFTLWSMMSAPLILGNDIRGLMNADGTINHDAQNKAYDVITNKKVIALNQAEPLLAAKRIQNNVNGIDILVKPLADQQVAVAFLNRNSSASTPQSLDLTTLKAQDSRATLPVSDQYSATDLWAATDATKEIGKTLTTDAIPGHGIKVYTISTKAAVGETHTIKISASDHGSVTTAPADKVEDGQSVTITGKADDGYKLAQVIVNGKTYDVSNNQYTVANVNEDLTIQGVFTTATVTKNALKSLTPITATGAIGDDWTKLNIPDKITGQLDNGDSVNIPVTWNSYSFDITSYKEQTVTGILQLPDSISNLDQLQPTVKIILTQAPVTDVDIGLDATAYVDPTALYTGKKAGYLNDNILDDHATGGVGVLALTKPFANLVASGKNYFTYTWTKPISMSGVALASWYGPSQGPTGYEVYANTDGTTFTNKVGESKNIVWPHNDDTIDSEPIMFDQPIENVKAIKIVITGSNEVWSVSSVINEFGVLGHYMDGSSTNPPTPTGKPVVSFPSTEHIKVSAAIDGKPINTGDEVTPGATVTFTVAIDPGYSSTFTLNGQTITLTGDNKFTTAPVHQDISFSVSITDTPLNWSNLDQAIAAAKKLVPDNYTPASFKAETFRQQTDASQLRIDSVADQLNDTIKALALKRLSITFLLTDHVQVTASVAGQPINSGAQVTPGTKVTFSLTVDKGYQATFMINGKVITVDSNNTFTTESIFENITLTSNVTPTVPDSEEARGQADGKADGYALEDHADNSDQSQAYQDAYDKAYAEAFATTIAEKQDTAEGAANGKADGYQRKDAASN
ncbi:MAG: alpha-galactosidase, partial [Schleiferilactobacillus perolens]|uniref:alpha-galactosidase n=1 Tax=Schleiferilactobacillus perolens TaxID=100468 RepID=UPI0039EA554B